MSIKFGRIDHSETGFTEQNFHKNQNLNSSSLGINHVLSKRDAARCKVVKVECNENNKNSAIYFKKYLFFIGVNLLTFNSGSALELCIILTKLLQV